MKQKDSDKLHSKEEQEALVAKEKELQAKAPLHHEEPLVLRSGRFGWFWGSSRYPLSKHTRELNIEELEFLAEGLEGFNIIKLRLALANRYSRNKQYEKAETVYNRVLDIYENAHCRKHPKVADVLSSFANLFVGKCEIERAEPLYREALNIQEEAYGSESSKNINTIDKLVEIYIDLKNYSNAEFLFKRLLTINEKEHGAEDKETAAILYKLAQLYCKWGDYEAAEAQYKRALSIYEKEFGQFEDSDSSDILYNQIVSKGKITDVLCGLARIYEDKDEYSEAEILLKRALAINEKVHSRKEHEVAEVVNQLAEFYFSGGEYEIAAKQYERLIEDYLETDDLENQSLDSARYNLAECYNKLGANKEADLMCIHVLEKYEKNYGKGDPKVAEGLNELAAHFCDLENYTKAKALYQRILSIYEKTYGPNDINLAHVLNSLAETSFFLGNNIKAKFFYIRLLVLKEKAYGVDHPSVASSLNDIGIFYAELGNFEKAKSLFERALSIYEEANISFNFTMLRVLNNLADLNNEKGKYDNAESLYNRVLTICCKILGSSTGKSIGPAQRATEKLVDLYLKVGKKKEAETMKKQLLNIDS